MSCCALGDCGRPTCGVCAAGRLKQPMTRLEWLALYPETEAQPLGEAPGKFATSNKPSRLDEMKNAPRSRKGSNRKGPNR